ncbi:beta-N-acetylhexosaminidase [Parabacteroides sp. OttesenSCG-928-G06]|nr:beta-N-acetylhexosaminidase [Parabacteroides sp. OttesenSCG-928-G06]
MKKNFILLFLFVSVLTLAQNYSNALIPMPNRMEEFSDKEIFKINNSTKIAYPGKGFEFEAKQLQSIINRQMGINIDLSDQPLKKSNTISLSIDPTLENREAYCLKIGKSGIDIKGGSKAGLFYAIMTLDQILLGNSFYTQQKQIVPLFIEDAPRFPHRILMLDPARHFIPIEDVKRYVDVMAKYKYNTLQLHLTDDQGWRVEIKKHPSLTTIGAKRNDKQGMNGPDNGFYTQEQLKDLIVYATERNIEIIPELDIPGHTVAMLAVYPELGCETPEETAKVIGKTTDLMLCANNDKVYEVFKDVIYEIADLFPSNKIHLGGDEAAIEKNWAKCKHCQALKEKLGYKKDSELMNYFFGNILSFVKEKNKTAVLWCELDNIRMPANEYLMNYPQDVILVSWRNGLTPKCLELTHKSNNQLILAPGEYTYLDYPQYKNDFPEFNNWGMPITTLKKTYQFDPGYGLPVEQQSHIIGVSGTLWAEAIKDINRVFYMTYPRGLALAEAGWTNMEHRDWESFKKRLYPNLSNLMELGIPFRVPFEIVE